MEMQRKLMAEELERLPRLLGEEYAQLGLAVILISKALRPTAHAELSAYRKRLQEETDRSKPDQRLVRTILKFAAE